MNLFDGAAQRAEQRRAERAQREIARLASSFTESTQISDAELESIRRWEGSAAADEALANSKRRSQYTPVSRTPAPSAATARPTDAAAPTQAEGYGLLPRLAVVAAVLTGVGGIILGFIALNHIRRTGGPGEGNARSAIVLGFTWIGIAIVWTVVSPLTS